MYTNDPFEEESYADGGYPACKSDLIKDMVVGWPENGINLVLLKLSLSGRFHMSALEKNSHLFAFTAEEANQLAQELLRITDTMGADFLERSGVHE